MVDGIRTETIFNYEIIYKLIVQIEYRNTFAECSYPQFIFFIPQDTMYLCIRQLTLNETCHFQLSVFIDIKSALRPNPDTPVFIFIETMNIQGFLVRRFTDTGHFLVLQIIQKNTVQISPHPQPVLRIFIHNINMSIGLSLIRTQ